MSPNAPTVIDLSAADLLLGGVLVLLAGVVSLALRLGLERRLGLAVARMILQLLLTGYVLAAVFRLESPWAVAPVLLLMVAVAARAAVKRPARGYDGVRGRGFGTLLLTGSATLLVATQLVIGVSPWYDPQYLIPLLGMILGNSLTGISLCLDSLLETLDLRRAEVEMELAHGATAWEAARGPLAEAVRRGLIPTINSMTVMGIVFLPGMMTGQILADVDPLVAVKYQIMIMFSIAGAVAMGSMLMALLTFRALFSERHQLLAGRIRPA
jgi:putative ABC transport system permease protein